ncbi:hypothetical protein [Aureivirga sp. CE67]|uniref:hypothetical protein n=1 Tax=Aureivirga sp. CE67 TaxID=1788983 RepID=UPI0018C95559|nr:hypothetical protein [Aureivirga sp. CE67]
MKIKLLLFSLILQSCFLFAQTKKKYPKVEKRFSHVMKTYNLENEKPIIHFSFYDLDTFSIELYELNSEELPFFRDLKRYNYRQNGYYKNGMGESKSEQKELEFIQKMEPVEVYQLNTTQKKELEFELPKLKKGNYLLVFYEGTKRENIGLELITVDDYEIVKGRYHNNYFIQFIQNQKLLKNTSVEFSDKNNLVSHKNKTNEFGQIFYKDLLKEKVVINKLDTINTKFNEGSDRYSNVGEEHSETMSVFFFEKEVFQPKDTLRFKAILFEKFKRNITPIQNKELEVKISGSCSSAFNGKRSQKLTTNEKGIIEGYFIIPETEGEFYVYIKSEGIRNQMPNLVVRDKESEKKYKIEQENRKKELEKDIEVLRIDVEKRIDRQDELKLSFRNEVIETKISLDGTLKIFELDRSERIDTLLEYDYFMGEESPVFKRYFPNEYFNNYDDYSKWESGNLVFEKKLNTEKEKSISIKKHKNWKLGKYKIVFENEKGEKVYEYFEIDDFDSDKLINEKLFTIRAENKIYHKKEKVRVRFGSSFKNVKVLLTEVQNGKVIKQELIPLNQNTKYLDFKDLEKSENVHIHYQVFKESEYLSGSLKINLFKDDYYYFGKNGENKIVFKKSIFDFLQQIDDFSNYPIFTKYYIINDDEIYRTDFIESLSEKITEMYGRGKVYKIIKH